MPLWLLHQTLKTCQLLEQLLGAVVAVVGVLLLIGIIIVEVIILVVR